MSGTTTRLPAHWYAAGYLPALCARHGEPATGRTPRDVTSSPSPWAYLTLLLGLIPFVVVVYATQAKVSGVVPTCARCTEDRRKFRLMVAGAWVGVVLLLLGGAVSGWLALAGFVAVVPALLLSFSQAGRVSGRVDRARTWVELRRVSPAFAAEIRRGLDRAATTTPVPAAAAVASSVAAPAAPAPARPVTGSALGPTILPGG